jgi:hypothetical protein
MVVQTSMYLMTKPFTVTHDGASHTAVYHNGERRWRCDCDGFDAAQNQCLHTELVKFWRQAQSERNGPPPPQTNRHWSAEIAVALLAPFSAAIVGWKAQATTKDGSRAMAVAYIDARAVADRLDESVGPENWCDGYIVLGEQRTSGGMEIVVACRLTVLGVTKEDVGTGEDYKAAYSDAFKRAGVRHGIGRYLYSLDKQWVAYDAYAKQLKETPVLPAWAVPG